MDYYGYYFKEPSFFGPAFEDFEPLLNDDKPDNEDVSNEHETKKEFPRSVFFIMGNEFCERFTFYGIRACLSVYLMSQLDLKQTTATSVFHTFLMICYFTPVFGSMIADGCLGKFRTIFYLSLIYALGSIVLSSSTIPLLKFPMLPMSMVGLLLIALGTGGIKPCVSAFGGDQFQYDQIKQRERFFFIFYFSINSGSLISTFLTPILKDKVNCFGNDTCYSLAFSVPAVLMIISIILFVAGRSMYTILPPQNNIIVHVSKCIGHAIKRRCTSKGITRDHWLDYADDEFDTKCISDVKAALRVMYLFLPLPLFWALFDQQGSLWTFQAQELDGRLLGSYEIIAEQMQLINPFLILIFIPVFELGIYPLFAKCNVFTKPLPRMFIGGLLAALAFVVAGVLQMAIESEYPSNPPVGYADITFINNGPCVLNVKTVNDTPFPLNITLDPANDTFYYEFVKAHVGTDVEIPVLVTPSAFCSGVVPVKTNLTLDENAIIVSLIVHDKTLKVYQAAKLCEKPAHGNSAIRLVYNLAGPGNRIMLKKEDSYTNCTFDNLNGAGITSDGINGTSRSDYCYTTPGEYHLHLPNRTGTLTDTGIKFTPHSGGQYDVIIYASAVGAESVNYTVNYYTEVAENDMTMLYQIPQYVIITCGEIMFSISGLEFSYSQAPASMKSVLQAAWLSTDAIGNAIVIIVAEAKLFDEYSLEYFLFAGLMAAVMFLFALMSMSYVYVSIDREGNVIYPEKQERSTSTSSLDSESTAALDDGVEDSVSVY